MPCVTPGTGRLPERIGSPLRAPEVRRWRRRKHPADRLDAVSRALRVDDRHHRFRRPSNSACAKHTDSARALAWSASTAFCDSALLGTPNCTAISPNSRASHRSSKWLSIGSRAPVVSPAPHARHLQALPVSTPIQSSSLHLLRSFKISIPSLSRRLMPPKPRVSRSSWSLANSTSLRSTLMSHNPFEIQ